MEEQEGFLADAVAMMVEDGEGLLPLLECVPVLGGVEELVATLSECHHLTHNCHVEFTPAQLSGVASSSCIVLGRKLKGTWCTVSEPASAASGGKLLYSLLLLQVDRPLLDTNALPLLQVLVELLLNLHCHISDDRTRDLCNKR